MNWKRISVIVLGSSLVLIGVVGLTGMLVGRVAAAAAAPVFMDRASGQMPPEITGLKDVPPAERFAHFKGIQASLTDKDGKPLNVTVTPGVAASVSAASVTLNGNDGAVHTFAIDGQTAQKGKTLAQGDDVVVVTLNNAQTATAVVAVDPAEFQKGGGGWHR